MRADFPNDRENRSEKTLHVAQIVQPKRESPRFGPYENPGSPSGAGTRRSDASGPRNRLIPRVLFRAGAPRRRPNHDKKFATRCDPRGLFESGKEWLDDFSAGRSAWTCAAPDAKGDPGDPAAEQPGFWPAPSPWRTRVNRRGNGPSTCSR